MAKEAILYYNGNAPGPKDLIRDIPIYAFHPGKTLTDPWASAPARSREDLRVLAAMVNPQVPVHIALPSRYANQVFKAKTRYEKLVLQAFSHVNSLSYMTGASFTIVFSNVKVEDVKPVMQYYGMPALVPDQRNHLEKKIQRDTYVISDVTLWAQQADVV